MADNKKPDEKTSKELLKMQEILESRLAELDEEIAELRQQEKRKE